MGTRMIFKDFESMGRYWHHTHKTKTKRAINLDMVSEPKLTVSLFYDTAIQSEDGETSIGYQWEVFRATEKGTMRSIPWYAHVLKIDGGIIKLPVAPAMRLLAA